MCMNGRAGVGERARGRRGSADDVADTGQARGRKESGEGGGHGAWCRRRSILVDEGKIKKEEGANPRTGRPTSADSARHH